MHFLYRADGVLRLKSIVQTVPPGHSASYAAVGTGYISIS
jgi:hypothetical protein